VFAATRFRLGGIALLILVWACAAAPAHAADVTISGPTVTEADAGIADATFTVTLTSTETADVTLDYQTIPGNPADPVDDFTPVTGQITFAVGETTKSIPVPVVGDAADEATELFFLEVAGPGLAEPAFGTATIIDNDATLGISDVTVNETSAGSANANFTVSVSSTDSGVITVSYATAPGTATSQVDYTETTGALTFLEGGSGRQTISVPIVGDTVDEPDETFLVNLTNPSPNVTITRAQGQATISDDDVISAPPPPGPDPFVPPAGSDPGPTVQARVLRGLTLVPNKRRVGKNSLVRLIGVLRVSGGPASCRSRQKIAIQRRKVSGGRFQTFEVAVTGRSGSFRTSTRPRRTYLYRARVSQTARCMGATSKTAKVLVRRVSKAGGAAR
jgi:hypothetical protein